MKKFLYNSVLPLFIIGFLGLTVIFVSQDISFYENQYEKNYTAEWTGLEKDDLIAVTKNLLSYMLGMRENLDMQYEVNGAMREIFTQREKDHMIDVKNLYLSVAVMSAAFTAYFVLGCLWLVKKDGFHTARGILSRKYKILLCVLAVIILILGGMFIIDFDFFWVNFHKVFFTNDLWILDPAQSIMINMFPLEFFFAMCSKIVIIFAVGCAVLFFVLGFKKKVNNGC